MKKNLIATLAIASFTMVCKKETALLSVSSGPPTPPPYLKGFMASAGVQYVTGPFITNKMASWGAKLIRVQLKPVKYIVGAGQGTDQTIWDAMPAYIDTIKQCLASAKNAGLKVVLDLHEPVILRDGKLSDAGYWRLPAFWDRADVKTNFIRFWKEVATALKNPEYNDVVYGYDIFNEPVENNNTTIPAHSPLRWREMAPDIIAEIRKHDTDVWIVYEPGPGGSTAAYANMQPLTDNKVIYSVHYYTPQNELTHVGLDYHSSTTATSREVLADLNKVIYPGIINGRYWDKAALAASLKPVDDFQARYNVPIYVGEFSVIAWTPVASSTGWLKDVTELFAERRWAWTYHAFSEWPGWSLEHPEGVDAFWFQKDGPPPPTTAETERAKVIKAALKTNTISEQ